MSGKTSPRYITARNPDNASDGAAIDLLSRQLGAPLMPWQRAVVDVATERDPADSRRWRYPVVVITIPRQSGKTTLLRALMTQRALMTPGLKCFMTAQTGKDARARWRDLAGAVAQCDLLASDVVLRRGAGAESLVFNSSGSVIAPFAPTPKSLHGYTPALVCIDEAWAFDSAQGADLMGAIVPAQQTLPDRQLWIVSTAGDARSTWLRDFVDMGRQAVGDPASPVCYAEWGAPEDVDPFDASQWSSWHPAVGHTIEADALESAAKILPAGEFVRAFANRWTQASQTVLKVEDLAGCVGEQNPAGATDTVLAFDVAPDRSGAAIWAAWDSGEGRVCLRPYMQQSGTAWLIPALSQAHAAGFAIWADDGGSTRAFIDAARLADVPVTTMLTRDFAAATGNLIQAVQERRVIRIDCDGLEACAPCASVRTLGGAMAWDRASPSPIHPIVAATVAMWALAHRESFWTIV